MAIPSRLFNPFSHVDPPTTWCQDPCTLVFLSGWADGGNFQKPFQRLHFYSVHLDDLLSVVTIPEVDQRHRTVPVIHKWKLYEFFTYERVFSLWFWELSYIFSALADRHILPSTPRYSLSRQTLECHFIIHLIISQYYQQLLETEWSRHVLLCLNQKQGD